MVEHANSLSVGSTLIKGGISLPNWFRFNYEEYDGWKKLFDADGHAVERTAIAVGWRFSYIMPGLERVALGLTSQSATHRAIKRVMDRARLTGFNSLEITRVALRRFLGLYRVTLVAHSRHLQPTPFLNDTGPRHYPRVEDVDEIRWRAAEVAPQVKGI